MNGKADNDESLFRTVQRIFNMDKFLNSQRTTQEAKKNRQLFSKGGFKLTKWITSDNDVKSQIPKTDRSTNVKTIEAEQQSSSILVPNWNVGKDRLTVCRGTEIDFQQKAQFVAASYIQLR